MTNLFIHFGGHLDSFQKDLFICHASEDKDEIVRPIYQVLSSFGFNIWYDEAEIKWGDSITQKVNWGLIHSRYVMVVISKNFLNKNWANREFNSILNQEASTGEVRVLPLIVEHESERISLQSTQLLLSDKKYLVWRGSAKEIVQELKKLFPMEAKNKQAKNASPVTEIKAELAVDGRVEPPSVLVKKTLIESLKGSQPLGTFIQPTMLTGYSFNEIISAFETGGNELFLNEEYLNAAIGTASQIAKSSHKNHRIFLQLSSTFFRYSNESTLFFRSLINDANLEPKDITVLFSEYSITKANIEKAVVLTAELKYEGFNIGMNNFGTGYSNLSHLRSLSITDLFIDRQFIDNKDMGTNHSILLAIMSLCSTLDIRAIAEGVTNDQQKLFLETTGCKFIENLSRPIMIQKE